MKITLIERGGIAPLHRPPLVLNAGSLAPALADDLRRLVSAAVSSTDLSLGTGRAYDGMNFTMTIESEEGETVIRQADSRMSPAFAALLNFVKQHAR